jgi:polyhydroxyalkanoate synthase
MIAQTLSIPAVANLLCAAHFAMTDKLHRAQGDALDALGLGPRECAFQLISSGPHWRLRAYGGPDAAPLLLMVPAPITRPYIWDLTPSVSAVRYCLHHGFRVHLLEWIPPSSDGSAGLDAYGGRAIAACVATISKQANGVQPFLMGHSLGGTLAAICCALEPRSVKGLVLFGAPLCFEPALSRFRDALVALVPKEILRDRRSCRRIAFIADLRRRIPQYVRVVKMDGRRSQPGRPCRHGHSRAH